MSAESFCLQLDVGNSGAKWRLMKGSAVASRGVYRTTEEASRAQLLGCAPVVDRIWISSVASSEAESKLSAMLTSQFNVQPWFALTAPETGELRNSYVEPERMGVDRWLAMLGAKQRSTGRLCVIDAGSALTIDLVSAQGEHEGGYIIPGPALMERALLLDTDRVRFDETVEYSLSPGTSTAQAVRHGIALAQVGAVSVALAQHEVDEDALFFCGGGGQLLQELLGMGGQLVPDLVFDGLEVMARASQ